MSDEFIITVATEPGGDTLLTVSGELDIATGEELRRQLHRALAQRQPVTVDLSGVTFFDCSGLGALISARRQAAVTGAQLRLRAISPAVEKILRLTRLEMAFPLAPPVAIGESRTPSRSDQRLVHS